MKKRNLIDELLEEIAWERFNRRCFRWCWINWIWKTMASKFNRILQD